MMRDGQHRDYGPIQLVVNGVRESLQYAAMNTVPVSGPDARAVGQLVDRLEDLGSESIGREQAALAVPQKCFADVDLRLGQDRDEETAHSDSRRPFASIQGAGCEAPARSAARRHMISSRHASEIAGSALLSRLSNSATTSADRSSVARARASSRMWSTRVFMPRSLAPYGRAQNAVHELVWFASSPSIRTPPRLRRVQFLSNPPHPMSAPVGWELSLSARRNIRNGSAPGLR